MSANENVGCVPLDLNRVPFLPIPSSKLMKNFEHEILNETTEFG